MQKNKIDIVRFSNHNSILSFHIQFSRKHPNKGKLLHIFDTEMNNSSQFQIPAFYSSIIAISLRVKLFCKVYSIDLRTQPRTFFRKFPETTK